MQNACDDVRREILSFLRWPREAACLSAVSRRWLHVTDTAKTRWLKSNLGSRNQRVLPVDFGYIAAFSRRPILTRTRAARAFGLVLPEKGEPDNLHYLQAAKLALRQHGSLPQMRTRVRVSKRARKMVAARRFPNTSVGYTRAVRAAVQEDRSDLQHKRRKRNSRWAVRQSYDAT